MHMVAVNRMICMILHESHIHLVHAQPTQKEDIRASSTRIRSLLWTYTMIESLKELRYGLCILKNWA